MPITPASTLRHPINFHVDEAMKDRLRLAAYQRRKSMSEIIRTALDEDLPALPTGENE